MEHEVDLESHSEVEMEPDSEIDLFEVELKRWYSRINCSARSSCVGIGRTTWGWSSSWRWYSSTTWSGETRDGK